ncbi:solute:Na+ symporter, SSS family [Verrucomicrobium sp. GAS474]|uniref:sodium:solute symporter family protein n=1 Tax=Verrucomicrobium sp. GAS474 TaxID=1882831 RepID=UPI000879B808|nr:sodium:solute symporter family protein [Verrucomicrobium sp. GAS474]SDU05687.1 solute:Na+ symporter, SSS family [Verrucomicrobium sp. GAS474]
MPPLPPSAAIFHLGLVDYSILAVYIAVVIGVGFALHGKIRNAGDFLLSGRSVPVWVTGLAFLSANLGAQEVIGMAASGAKYGIMTSHFYWVGAIPAMVFLAVFMMPFYYGSKARSVPEYLKLRFDERTRALNSFTFALMTVISSGVSLHALASLLRLLLGWNYDVSIALSSVVVLLYVLKGGLTSAIYTEVMQFFLIVLGFAPLVYLGLRDLGGWEGMAARLPEAFTHSWRQMGTTENPMGVEWFTMVFGLGFVLSFGYWCTDFLVVQRAMAAHSMSAARRTPLVGAVPKMLFPFLVIVPGMIAVALATNAASGYAIPLNPEGRPDYNMVIPSLLLRYCPEGLLGLGLTALLASFMSGMAGNVTAFNTVWTYDIYQSRFGQGKDDAHFLRVGKAATLFGILASIGFAYLARSFNNIMDALQLVFAFVNAPLFATFLLGMFWKRTTGAGAFYGLLSGTVAAAVFHGLSLSAGGLPGIRGAWIAQAFSFPSEMAQNFWVAIVAWCACFTVTLGVSLATPRTKSDAELAGLVYSLTPKAYDTETCWHKKPAVLGILILLAALVLNLIFA